MGGFGAKPGSRKPYGNPGEVFPALGFAAHFKKICKNKTLRLLRIPPKLLYIYISNTHDDGTTQMSVRESHVDHGWQASKTIPERWWASRTSK